MEETILSIGIAACISSDATEPVEKRISLLESMRDNINQGKFPNLTRKEVFLKMIDEGINLLRKENGL